jgi:hypothetical protein
MMHFKLLQYAWDNLHMSFWIKPHLDGIVFSSNRRMESNDLIKPEEMRHDNIDWHNGLPGERYSIDTHTRDKTYQSVEKPVGWYIGLSEGDVVIGTSAMAWHGYPEDGFGVEYFKWSFLGVKIDSVSSGTIVVSAYLNSSNI